MARRIAYLWLDSFYFHQIESLVQKSGMGKKTVNFGGGGKLRITYLQAKHVFWVLENPASSLLWRYKAIREPCLRFIFGLSICEMHINVL